MPIHVDEMTSEVIPESEPVWSGGSAEANSWEALAQLRDQQARLLRDRLRTAAEGFDD
jgi:hypothetical protein